jgi:hypothetical protein
LALIVWGVLVTFITEITSVFRLLTFGSLLLIWLLIDITLICIYSRLYRKNKKKFINLDFNVTYKWSFCSTLQLGSLITIVVIIGLTALIAPPNTWDSMTYHMSRVVHWIQNQSVAHYPTSITRQLYLPPWAEYAIAHLQILSNSDRFANLVQWFSLVGSIIGVSLIAKQLYGNLRSQIVSAVVCVTIPIGILQGSSTQNDYVVAFWLVCFVYFSLLAIQSRINFSHSVLVGISLGLAILTKPTAYIYAFPFFCWLMLSGKKRLGWKLWKPFITIIAIVILINIGHYLRNLELYGSFLGESGGYTNQIFGIRVLISNIIRNLALHISTPIGSIAIPSHL